MVKSGEFNFFLKLNIIKSNANLLLLILLTSTLRGFVTVTLKKLRYFYVSF